MRNLFSNCTIPPVVCTNRELGDVDTAAVLSNCTDVIARGGYLAPPGADTDGEPRTASVALDLSRSPWLSGRDLPLKSIAVGVGGTPGRLAGVDVPIVEVDAVADGFPHAQVALHYEG